MRQTCRRRKRSSKRRKRRRRKNSEWIVNDGRTPASSHQLNVLDEPNRLSQPECQSELIWNSSNGFRPWGCRSSRAANRPLIIGVSCVLTQSSGTARDKSIEPTNESIGSDLQKFERGQPWWWSTAANRVPLINVLQYCCILLMYSTRRIDWACLWINHGWFAQFWTWRWSSVEKKVASRLSVGN